MGEILLIGTTHYPPLLYPDEGMVSQLRKHMESDRVPSHMREERNWPKEMQAEYGPNGSNAMASAAAHREHLVKAFRSVRQEIDAFRPDFVLIWGDDQYENFREDLVPPFSVYIADKFETQPFKRLWYSPSGEQVFNVWGEPVDKVFVHQGHADGAKYLTSRLLEMGYPMPYSYKPLHFQGLPHAFMNTLLFLDYDRKGFDYPVVPFHVNCYGSSVVRNRGGSPLNASENAEPDPPAPSPRLCFDVGAATARALKDSPYRSVLIGSSSWSHAFLTLKHHMLWPDVEADRARFEELREGKQHLWKDLTLDQIEDAGQQELLNWVCLAGAITELGYKPEIIDFTQTYIFNSSKCMMVARA
jgi:hypothetical protein